MATIYRGQNVPVFIGTTYVIRAQSFQVSREQSVEVVTEPGPGYEWVCGEIIGIPIYRASLEIYEVGPNTLYSLGFISDAQTYLRDDAQGPLMGCLMGGLTNTQITGITWTSTAQGGARCRIDLTGDSWLPKVGTVPAADLTKPGAYHAEYCCFSVGSSIKAQVQSASVRVQMPCQFIYELHSSEVAVPIGRVRPSLNVAVSVESVYDGGPAWIAGPDAAQSLNLEINETEITVQKAVSAQNVVSGSSRGWATTVHNYVSTTNVVIV